MFLNEIEPFAADWLASEYPGATIDRRSIADIAPADLAGFRRVHFFAGIGGWEIALRLAGWPDDREVWTGSCPCQPFSAAGKRQGTADERHLWPEMFRLIRERRPATVFGEQVASSDGLAWLDGVFADLEGAGYACGAADLCAAGVGAPHIRQRLYWVAHYTGNVGERGQYESGRRQEGRAADWRTGEESHRLANADGQDTGSGQQRLRAGDRRGGGNEGEQERAAGWLANASGPRPQERRDGDGRAADLQREAAVGAGAWSDCRLEQLRDGTARRVGAGVQPLAHGIPVNAGPLIARLCELGVDPKTAKRIIANARRNRTGRIRAYGNAIVPQVAVEFVRAVIEQAKASE